MAAESTLFPPVIDMANFPAELEKLTTASTGMGCFRVVNHGIPHEVMEEINGVVRSLAEMPVKTKLRNTDVIFGSGYIAPTLLINPLQESFGIYDAACAEDVRNFGNILELLPRHRDILSTFASEFHYLTVELAKKISESLGLVGYSFEDWSCIMRLNHYSFTSETVGSSALQIHTDPSFLTVLKEDETVGGLEVLDSNGNFVAIDPVPNSLLVFVGDIAKAWSNGSLHNVKHQVICKEAAQRFSVLFALLSPKDGKIEPQVGLIDSKHPRLYDTFTLEDYRKIRISYGLKAGEALPLVKPRQPVGTLTAEKKLA